MRADLRTQLLGLQTGSPPPPPPHHGASSSSNEAGKQGQHGRAAKAAQAKAEREAAREAAKEATRAKKEALANEKMKAKAMVALAKAQQAAAKYGVSPP